MKKRMISLALAMAMCFALGITSFAVEPPTLHQTMMELSPGYEPNAWGNWIGPFVETNNKHAIIETEIDVIFLLCDIVMIAINPYAPTASMEMFATDVLNNEVTRLKLERTENIYYRYTYKTRVNEATSQMQHHAMVELYADEDYRDLIDVYIDTYTTIVNINKSI